MFLDQELILRVMKAARIPGVSIAIIGREGEITPLPLGTTGCGLFRMDEEPTKEAQNRFDSSRYILTNNCFLYYDAATKNFQTITTDESKLGALSNYFKDKKIFSLSEEQTNKIKTITGHEPSREEINADTVFAAASLSKPVFAYLVLKLIEENKSNRDNLALGKFALPQGLTHFDLDTPLVKVLPGLSEGGEKSETLTARMVLSHTTGIPMSTGNKAPEFLFEPDTAYGYNGVPYLYLQMVIEKLTGKPLEDLAREHVFKGMDNTTFVRPGFTSASVVNDSNQSAHFFPIDFDSFPANSANSLRTTAEDYALFMQRWMNDPVLSSAFNSKISLSEDQWAKGLALPNALLKKLSWGLGVGLQADRPDHITGAFHNGDMNEWRAIMAMDPEHKTGVVFFTNSPNGDILAEEVVAKILQVQDCLQYISEKYGFATKFEENWEIKQQQRFDKIDYYFESVSGKHASEADWVSEELDYQAHKNDYLKPVIEENVMHSKFRESFRKLKANQPDNSTHLEDKKEDETKCAMTPLETPKPKSS